MVGDDGKPDRLQQRAYCCPYCDVRGTWTVERVGDAIVSWSCPEHLSQVCEWLQRDWEVTELRVHLSAKAAEWAGVGATLDEIAKGGAP